MIAGFGHLHLASRDFWAMTPREFDAALRGHLGLDAAGPTLSRQSLDHLIAAFPDVPSARARAAGTTAGLTHPDVS
jgi:uncharacterized phage protein (TIGR02216 family)